MDSKDKVINDLLSRIAKLEYEVEEKNKTISKALHKLRASKDHFKTERENNTIVFVIRILESDKE